MRSRNKAQIGSLDRHVEDNNCVVFNSRPIVECGKRRYETLTITIGVCIMIMLLGEITNGISNKILQAYVLDDENRCTLYIMSCFIYYYT